MAKPKDSFNYLNKTLQVAEKLKALFQRMTNFSCINFYFSFIHVSISNIYPKCDVIVTVCAFVFTLNMQMSCWFQNRWQFMCQRQRMFAVPLSKRRSLPRPQSPQEIWMPMSNGLYGHALWIGVAGVRCVDALTWLYNCFSIVHNYIDT